MVCIKQKTRVLLPRKLGREGISGKVSAQLNLSLTVLGKGLSLGMHGRSHT